VPDEDFIDLFQERLTKERHRRARYDNSFGAILSNAAYVYAAELDILAAYHSGCPITEDLIVVRIDS
jgi:hypothetical protein